LAEWDPDSILRVKEPIALDYDMTAMAMELERRGQSPVLWFEKVGDSPFAVISNVFGNRKRYAFALGVEETELFDAWGRLGDKLYPPELVKTGPILDNVLTRRVAWPYAHPVPCSSLPVGEGGSHPRRHHRYHFTRSRSSHEEAECPGPGGHPGGRGRLWRKPRAAPTPGPGADDGGPADRAAR
jgi:hypothetical protein